MEEKQTLVKTIKKSFKSKIEAGITWFKFIGAINNISLTKRELQLLSFINYRGTISSLSSKQEFCKIFESSTGTITNMTPRLLREKFLVKDKSKIRINPALGVNFDNDFVVRFFIDVKNQTNNDGN